MEGIEIQIVQTSSATFANRAFLSEALNSSIVLKLSNLPLETATLAAGLAVLVSEHATLVLRMAPHCAGRSLEYLFGQAFSTDIEGATKPNFLSRFAIDDCSTRSVGCSDWNVVF
jgi:hypothetical protein